MNLQRTENGQKKSFVSTVEEMNTIINSKEPLGANLDGAISSAYITRTITRLLNLLEEESG